MRTEGGSPPPFLLAGVFPLFIPLNKNFSPSFVPSNSNMFLCQRRSCSRRCVAVKKPAKALSPPNCRPSMLDWLMWKVCAEPTTSAGVGLWNSNSHEERPTSPVTPNPAAAVVHSLFLIPLFHSVHHLRVLSFKQSRRRHGGRRGCASGGRAAKSGWAIKESGFGGDQRSRPHRFQPKPERPAGGVKRQSDVCSYNE